MNKKTIIGLILFTIFVICCTTDKLEVVTLDDELEKAIEATSKTGSLEHYILPDETDYASLPNQDPKNPITAEKVRLGKFLFFETGLAQKPYLDKSKEAYSCSSCHIPSAGFLPGRIQGIADGGRGYGENGEARVMQAGYDQEDLDAQGTRPMNPLNSTYVTNTLWSGAFGAHGVNEGTEYAWTGLAEVNHTGYVGLEAQNIEAFDLHRLEINDHVLDDYGYRPLYDDAFPDFPEEERYSPTTSSFAISAYLRTMITNKAAFQEWLKGDKEVLTKSQKNGALLFFTKGNCTNCHKEPSFSAMTFHAMGTQDMYAMGGLNTGPDDVRNLGRGMFTGNEEDHYKFKVPQLYNLKDYAAYFHGSSISSLEDLVDFKVAAQSQNPNVPNDKLSGLFRPTGLTELEKSQLVDFLRNALYDPDVARYAPDQVLSGNCFPNNDVMSRRHLGCN